MENKLIALQTKVQEMIDQNGGDNYIFDQSDIDTLSEAIELLKPQTELPKGLFVKKDVSERALTLKGKIKNLQVSISIFKKEMDYLSFRLEHSDEETLTEFQDKWSARRETLKVNIAKKEEELVPLIAEREAAKLTAQIVEVPAE